ncbi:MAG: acetyltransferase [Flavobacteriaceae bacterium]|nr:acetyltransferase [Flavobacteriaceae bacterium]
MKEKIALYGAGGHAYAIVELIRSGMQFEPSVIFDDAPKQKEILGVPVRSFSAAESPLNNLCISIGNPEIRKRISSRFQVVYPTFIHNSTVLYPSVKIGMGAQILPGSILDADVVIGDHCIVNNNATISHNVRVGDYCHVSINAAISGGVSIGEGTLLGAGCVVLPEISIGKWAIVGAGAIVTKDVPDFAVVYGNPAKIIRYQDKG